MVDPEATNQVPDWLTAIAIAIAIGIFVFVFAWIVIQLEPVMSDFIAPDSPPATATPGPDESVD